MKTREEILKTFYEEEKRRDDLEHRDVLLAIGSLLKTNEGIKLFEYLFKSFDVANVPERGLSDNNLHEYLGFLRAGNSIYKLACEADPNIAASILSKTERKRYEYKFNEHRIQNGFYELDNNN